MRSLALVVILVGGLAAVSPDHEWKVRDVTLDPKSDQSKLMLVVSKTRIQIVRRADDSVLTTIDPGSVVSLWYDDKLVDGSLGRKWWSEIERACRAACDDPEQFNPLVGLAVGGLGYLVAEPFSKRRHFANIRYREGDRIEWLTLGTTWFDHFWLMTDLSQATGLKWLNLPLQRTKLFWSFGDHSYQFDPWHGTGDTQVHAGVYDVVLWEDGKGRGVLLVFTRGDPETPVAVAVEQVTVEGPASHDGGPEYCRDENGIQRLRRLAIKHKQLVLPVWDAACRRVPGPSN